MKADVKGLPFYTDIRKVIDKGGFEAYFVGGCVRDILLNRRVHDVDMVCFSHDYKEFASAVKDATGSVWVEFKDNIRLVRDKTEIDISAPRGEKLEQDLLRRDFTINNLAADIDGNIYGDMSDLKEKVLRHVGPASFTDDPLRILRTYRFYAQLGFRIAPETIAKIEEEKYMLSEPASERIYAEMSKLAGGRYAFETVREMATSGLFEIITDGIACLPVDIRPIRIGLCSFLASICTRLDKDERSKLAAKLNLPNDVKKRTYRLADFVNSVDEAENEQAVRAIIYHYPEEVTDGLKIYKMQRDVMKKPEEETDATVQFFTEQRHLVRFDMALRVNGKMLSDNGIEPGPLMGRVMKDVRLRLATGELVDVASAERYIKDNY